MEKARSISHRLLKKSILFRFLTLSVFLGITVQLSAQKTPKIGLVLSGGGAKGMAHIGILKALEEAGITPDFITGTSMGSIMGGLYSSGYTADEIKKIALTVDWDQLLTNKLKLNEVAFEENDYYGRYFAELNVKGTRFELPKGLIEGQKLSMTLSTLTRHVMNIQDFSMLPIPFACIAADIENGNRIVLNKGSLARSMRASMAIPTVFTPVVIDNQLLVDGGLVNNFPWEVATLKNNIVSLNNPIDEILPSYKKATYQDLLWMAKKSVQHLSKISSLAITLL